MAKTIFSSGSIVTSEWLNGARNLVFDGQNLDWHYDPLGLSSLQVSGPNGLDSRYITLYTNQPSLSSTGALVTGRAISGDKVVTGQWNFGYNPQVNPDEDQNFNQAPKSYLTNLKYEDANGIATPSYPQKLAALEDPDILTKLVFRECLENFTLDDGFYGSQTEG
jgi:hypothetical protein